MGSSTKLPGVNSAEAQAPIPAQSLPPGTQQLSHCHWYERGLHTQRSLVSLKLGKASLVFIRLGLRPFIFLSESAAHIFKHRQLEKWSSLRMRFPRWLGINTTALLIHSINSRITPAHGSWEFGSIPKSKARKFC